MSEKNNYYNPMGQLDKDELKKRETAMSEYPTAEEELKDMTRRFWAQIEITDQRTRERDELRDALEHAAAFVVAFTRAAPSLAEISMNYRKKDTGEQGEITPNQIIDMSEKALEKLKSKGGSDE